MSAPLPRTLAASARLTAGLTVLMSAKILPCPSPASSPSGPSVMADKATALVTMAKVTSPAADTALGESAHPMPRSISHCAFDRVRLYPVTVWPLLSSRFTIWLPITPRPTNPRLAMCLQTMKPASKAQAALRSNRFENPHRLVAGEPALWPALFRYRAAQWLAGYACGETARAPDPHPP